LAELGLVRLKTATPSWRSEDLRPRSDIGSVNLTMDWQDELGNCCVTVLFGDGFFDVGTRMVDISSKTKSLHLFLVRLPRFIQSNKENGVIEDPCNYTRLMTPAPFPPIAPFIYTPYIDRPLVAFSEHIPPECQLIL
jgi:hypothetical protein